MTNEIKEILKRFNEFLKGGNYTVLIMNLTKNEVKTLLDYITNLQDKLKWYENIDPNNTIDKFRYEQNMKVKNLHQRIDKVVEYIENNFLYHYGSYEKPIVFEDNYIQDLYDILRGDE